uniref:Uncharacterized protein n=1 Tax=Triticum urartu TaxID=4572 RepID=A0A8R7UAS0_TRIUA
MFYKIIYWLFLIIANLSYTMLETMLITLSTNKPLRRLFFRFSVQIVEK